MLEDISNTIASVTWESLELHCSADLGTGEDRQSRTQRETDTIILRVCCKRNNTGTTDAVQKHKNLTVDQERNDKQHLKKAVQSSGL